MNSACLAPFSAINESNQLFKVARRLFSNPSSVDFSAVSLVVSKSILRKGIIAEKETTENNALSRL